MAISAGIDHWLGRMDAEGKPGSSRHHTLHSGSPHIHALDPRNSPLLTAIPEPDEETSKKVSVSSNRRVRGQEERRKLLRLDPFLGEWLCPDYFENITPPPSSKMMVASAKADLLRRGDPLEGLNHPRDGNTNSGSFPGGWTSSYASPHAEPVSTHTGTSFSSEPEKPPKLARAKTHSALATGRKGLLHYSSWMDSDPVAENSGYSPPSPPYTISPVQPIPQGYVAHARDACINVDYQWDSMRTPLKWGSGGEYGEEWGWMHRRFRTGFHKMISWYCDHKATQEPEGTLHEVQKLQHTNSQPTELSIEDEEDLVLILVTHGAGCNALIGALTNQPVLIDVGLASLTMAVRKNNESLDFSRASLVSVTPLQRRSSIDQGTSQDYEVKLMASTDHIRPGSQFLGGLSARARSPSLPVREKSPYRYERHVGSPNRKSFSRSPARDRLQAEAERITKGSFEEDQSAGDGKQRANTTSDSTGGLWSKPAVEISHPHSPVDASRVEAPKLDITKAIESHNLALTDLDSPHLPNGITKPDEYRGSAQPGLWRAESRVVQAPKRRWTLGQA